MATVADTVRVNIAKRLAVLDEPLSRLSAAAGYEPRQFYWVRSDRRDSMQMGTVDDLCVVLRCRAHQLACPTWDGSDPKEQHLDGMGAGCILRTNVRIRLKRIGTLVLLNNLDGQCHLRRGRPSLARLAKGVSVSPRGMQAFMRGERNGTTKTAEDFSLALAMEPWELLEVGNEQTTGRVPSHVLALFNE